MSEKQTNKISTWMISRPLIFAVCSFIAMTVAAMLAGAINPATIYGPVPVILISVAFLAAAAFLVRMLPGTNLDRRSFVALANAQMIVTSTVFIATTLIAITNARNIMIRLLWLESHSSLAFMMLMIVAALFYLYLCGIYIGNLYAKYRRVRAMGVSMWKTLATAPFGFCLLWIPGYLMEEKNKQTHVLEIKTKWYARVTEWIMGNPVRCAAVLVALILLSGFFFGFGAIMLTLVMMAIFIAWSAVTGQERLKKNIGGTYATTAIILNIVSIITIIGYLTLYRPGVEQNHMQQMPMPGEQITVEQK